MSPTFIFIFYTPKKTVKALQTCDARVSIRHWRAEFFVKDKIFPKQLGKCMCVPPSSATRHHRVVCSVCSVLIQLSVRSASSALFAKHPMYHTVPVFIDLQLRLALKLKAA